MPVIPFRGEKSLGEIADKLYNRLTPKQREKVESALLQQNPQLADLAALPTGTLVRLPQMPELSAKARAGSQGPQAEVAAQLGDGLGAYAKQLTLRYRQAMAALAETQALLGDEELRRAIAKEPALQALAKDIGPACEARAKQLEQRQKAASEGLKQALADLQAGFGKG